MILHCGTYAGSADPGGVADVLRRHESGTAVLHAGTDTAQVVEGSVRSDAEAAAFVGARNSSWAP